MIKVAFLWVFWKYAYLQENPCLARYPKDIPRQHNAVDCGVFALMFAEHAARDAPLSFSEADMPLLRLKLAADIVASKVA